nr:N-acyl-D-amino-acid deacylase [uncultured bacterium]BAH90109.1 N-acyl-D-amino-acid deacylase [uncultured bacterium]
MVRTLGRNGLLCPYGSVDPPPWVPQRGPLTGMASSLRSLARLPADDHSHQRGHLP